MTALKIDPNLALKLAERSLANLQYLATIQSPTAAAKTRKRIAEVEKLVARLGQPVSDFAEILTQNA